MRISRLWLPIAIVLLYVYSFPYFEQIRSANELPRIYLTISMVDRQAFDIGPYVRQFQPTPDLSRRKGKLYSNKAPGMSLFAIPGYLALKAVGDPTNLKQLFYWLRLSGATIPSLLFLWLVWWMLGQLVKSLRVRQLVFFAYGLGTMAFVYGTLLLAHQLSAALIGAAFFLVFLFWRGRGDHRMVAAAGFVAGLAVLVDYQAAFMGPPLFVYVLVRARLRFRSAVLFCFGAALPLAALLYYHYRCFGSPFQTGYHHLANPVFAQWTSKGFLGLGAPQLERLLRLHFSPDDGLFFYSPFLLLAFPGLVLMCRRSGLVAEGILSAVGIAFFIFFASALGLVSGWDVGPRYVTVALPFYLMPVAVMLDRLSEKWWQLALPAALIVVSVVTYVWIGAVFPHFPDNFSNPFYDVTVRFSLAHYVPYNLGWALGLQGFYSLVPYFVVVAALLGGALWGAVHGARARLGLLLTTIMLSVALFGGYYGALGSRGRPVPYGFIPWMERIWEPRNPRMKASELQREIGLRWGSVLGQGRLPPKE